MEGMNVCKCPHHKVMPLAVLLIGVVFLLQAMGTVSAMFVMYAWPILLIVAVLPKLGGCKCCSNP
jgi:K+ transporter